MSKRLKVQKQPPSIPPCQGGGASAPPVQKHAPSSLPDKGGRGEGLSDKGGRGEGFLPYDRKLTLLARQNRSNPTQAERTIWRDILRKRQFARFKFLRQKPIGRYIVDFYCSELRVVVEIDGDSHAETVAYDGSRTRFLNSHGLQVIRYTNDEVLNNLEGVYEDLSRQLLLEEAKP